MAPDFILQGCNPSQREAILFDHDRQGPLLILAGAGSGKTSVLTKRILWLVSQCGVNSAHILGLTFTAKAAAEMRERLDQSIPGSKCKLCTFHSLALYLIREKVQGIAGWERLGFKKMPVMGDGTEKGWASRVTRVGLSSKDLPREKLFAPWEGKKGKSAVVSLQQEILKECLIQFEDLIWLGIHLLKTDILVRESVQRRFHFLLVDEYQDINPSQYQLVRLIIGNRPNLFAVGDDDQAIYGFRGADIGNILRFQEDYPGCKVLKLEWNYRSTSAILEVANAIFPEKPLFLQKRLRPGNARGDLLFRENAPVEVWKTQTPMQELDALSHSIQNLRMQYSLPWKAFAILVRYHRQREWYTLALASRSIPLLCEDHDGVQIETLHASKGLQYPVVYYAGLAEGISPGAGIGGKKQSQQQRQEEKRLFYVGVTRAESRLYLLFCNRRHWQGLFREFKESPFLKYVPRKKRVSNVTKFYVLVRIAMYMAWAMAPFFVEKFLRSGTISTWMELKLAHWAKFCLGVNGYQMRILGQAHLAGVDWTRPVFVVSNHQSYMDIPAVLVSMERKLGFVAKKELGNIPFLGYWMNQIGCLLIERGKAGVAQNVAEAIQRMPHAPNLVIFPEGTRSKDGKLASFKSGAFRMAMDHKAIIVPMVLRGTREGWEDRRKNGVKTPLVSTILAPIDCVVLQQENPQFSHKDLMSLVRSTMEKEIQATAE